ncbi:MAG: YgaP family membrane protein [Acidobacteriota bacterium]
MQRNVGGADRMLRLALGAAIIGVGVYYRNWWGAVGIVPILTAAIGWCPAYLPFGVSSCRVKR